VAVDARPAPVPVPVPLCRLWLTGASPYDEGVLPSKMKPLAENLWVLPYPLRLLGADFRRMVTVVRLGSGQLVIHSTGPFTAAEVAAISGLGRPGWLLEALLRHDTFPSGGAKPSPVSPSWPPRAFPESSVSRPSRSCQCPPRGATNSRPCG
jgi:hypothetical protein